MGFDADKSFGAGAEDAVVRMLSRLGLFCRHVNSGEFAGFDVEARGLYEVKRDGKAGDTGSFFVETHQRGRPSGISGSRAFAWVLVRDADGAAWIVPVEQLRTVLDSLTPVAGPDGKVGRLLPVARLTALGCPKVNLRNYGLRAGRG